MQRKYEAHIFLMVDQVKPIRKPFEIYSPQPKRRRIEQLQTNPFVSKADIFEESELSSEISQILSRHSVPDLRELSSSSDSPKYTVRRMPRRLNTNPVVFDEKFLELDSSMSTAEPVSPRSADFCFT